MPGWLCSPGSSASLHAELLVLRHENAVLRRTSPQPKLDWSDRFLLAGLIRRLPTLLRRQRLVTTVTVLAWNRRLVAKHRTLRVPWNAGNGRMSRSLQTLIIAREGVLAPEFSSIEAWPGQATNTWEYCQVHLGRGRSYRPDQDVSAWLRFNLTAYHQQAQTVQYRLDRSAEVWARLETFTTREQLDELSTAWWTSPSAVGGCPRWRPAGSPHGRPDSSPPRGGLVIRSRVSPPARWWLG